MNDPSPPSVLIVDDETDFRDLLTFEFSTKGYLVQAAENGEQALRLLREQTPDVVVTDIRMPDADGIQLLHAIKSTDVHRPAVVCISGYADITPEEAYDLGSEAILTKPLRLAALVETVRRLSLPMAKRWATPPTQPPMYHVRLEIPSLGAGRKDQRFALGRGGICLAAPHTMPEPGGRLGFEVTLAEPPLKRVAGVGLARWFRAGAGQTATPFCGLEFEYLDDESREPVIRWALEQAPRAYIPSLTPRANTCAG